MRKHRGDTIVEVLFAMVVIGISLAAAFGIANRSLQISRASQERTEAQKIAESQIELIKAAITTDGGNLSGRQNSIIARITNPSQNFCLYRDNSGEIDIANRNANNSPCQNLTPLDSAVEYAIDVSFERSGPGNSGEITQFAVTVTWDRIGTNSTEPGTLTLYYRPGIIAGNCSNGNPERDLAAYARRNDVSGGDLRIAVNVIDVGVGLFSTVNRSSPDIVLSRDLNTSTSCNYDVTYTVYCTVNQQAGVGLPPAQQNPVAFDSEPSICGGNPASVNNQTNESIVVNFHEGYSGNRSNAQCQGSPVATLTTEDRLNGPTVYSYTTTARLNILTRNRNANCIELVHFCAVNPTVGSCAQQPNIGNSVLLRLIDWREA